MRIARIQIYAAKLTRAIKKNYRFTTMLSCNLGDSTVIGGARKQSLASRIVYDTQNLILAVRVSIVPEINALYNSDRPAFPVNYVRSAILRKGSRARCDEHRRKNDYK